jgi:alanyl-tRNA synthetase
MKSLTSSDIRGQFIRYFESKGHKAVASSSLVPQGDATLLFTNAGMNQFKGIFTGQEKRDYQRAVSSQKCVRAGGKHNDLENVGHTARHHTFFEMLGNFSFGDYFKKEAIDYAWEFLTKELQIPSEKLYVTVFQDDDEAFGLWEKNIGIPKEKISRFGVKDNFWSMGDTGPCGPCSEIFYDQGEKAGCGKPTCKVGCDCDRYMEIWNLVFMEFEQRSDGTRVKLPKPSIDTGMGLERVTSVMQGKINNYDTDLFESVLAKLSEWTGIAYGAATAEQKVSMRVIADHIRSTTFLISDGVNPSKDGRGYVLRRIMRRAMRHGRKLGLMDPFMHKLSDVQVEKMKSVYPELDRQKTAIQSAILDEEKKFSQTVDQGMDYLLEHVKKISVTKGTTFPGDVAFRLYDTYGFPVDLTQDVLREHQLTLDQQAFDEAAEAHREKARGSWKGSQTTALDELVTGWSRDGLSSIFLGYDKLVAEGKIEKIVREGKEVGVAKAGDEIEIVAGQTPFYGESGGQVGDIGSITTASASIEVLDTKKPSPSIIVHQCKVLEGELKVGDDAVFTVDAKARTATAKNHTATHLLHALLVNTLGEHVVQKGSLVAPERLRFDFTHTKPMSENELVAIEQKLNEQIWQDDDIAKDVMPIEKAMASGAKALFDEKYGAEVRVISVSDYSKELCGGTHIDRTGEIGLFKIIKESSVAAGIRRIEAYTGHRALRYVHEQDVAIKQLAAQLGVSPDAVSERVSLLLKQQKELKSKGAAAATSNQVAKKETIGSVVLSTVLLEGVDAKNLREVADRNMEEIKQGIVVVASQNEGRASLVIKISKDLAATFNASAWVKELGPVLGGSGGVVRIWLKWAELK